MLFQALKKQTPISKDPLDNTRATLEAAIAHRIITDICVQAKDLGCTRARKLNPNYPGRSRL